MEGGEEGCLGQIGHFGNDRTMELLRAKFYWPGLYKEVTSHINSCPRCLRRKSQDVASVINIETAQPPKLLHMDYLQIEHSK